MIRDNCYIITKDGCIGCIIGDNHPHNGFLGLLIYVPEKLVENKQFPKSYCKKILGKRKIKIAKLFTESRKKSVYDSAFRLIAKLFPQYDYKDEFWGHINFFPKKKILKIVEGGNFSNKKNCLIIKALEPLLGLRRGEIILIGSKSFGSNEDTDLDIVVKGMTSCIKVRNKIMELVKIPDCQHIEHKGKANHRRFLYNKELICTFFKYKNKQEEPLGKFSYKLGKFKLITDKIIDDAHSVFMPALYILEKNSFLLTYFLEHRMLFKNGDKIRFKAREVTINSSKFSGKGFLITSRGEWVKIFKK